MEYLREERFPFPLRYLSKNPCATAYGCVATADGIAYDLLGALRRVGFYLDVANSDEQGWKSAGINPKQPNKSVMLAKILLNGLLIPKQNFITGLGSNYSFTPLSKR